MKKAKFLIPVSAAVAAISGNAQACNTIVDAEAQPSSVFDAAATNLLTPQKQVYLKGNELHALMMMPSASGEILAWHSSHASHESHSSHYSHRSGS